MKKLYVLCLAHMTGGVDKSQPICCFDDLEKLKEFYNSNLAENPWSEQQENSLYKWYKVFKKESPLEWFNPLSPINQSDEDIFKPVSWHDAAFGGIVVHGYDDEFVFTQESFNIPFNPKTIIVDKIDL